MKKTLLLFFLSSSFILGAWGIIGGFQSHFLAFALGLGVFAGNLVLWTIVVRELLTSAAYAGEALQSAGEAPPPSEAGVTPGPADPAGSDNRTDGSRPVAILVTAMLVKLLLLGGGVYLCLAIFKLAPFYFVGGLAAGLGLFAVAAFVASR